MSFVFEKEQPAEFLFDEEKLAEDVVRFCLEHEAFPYEAEVSLTVTDNAGIREINRRFRDTDRETDVLSFPLLTYEKAGDFAFLEEERDTDFNPDTGEAMLGDIVISAEKVKEQAKAYGHSEKREFAFLIVHSMLHLFGYDHITPDEAQVMEAKQKQILEELQITR